MNTACFENVQQYAMDKLRESGNEMMDGKISIYPYQKKKETACDFCDYREVCRFDGRIDEYHVLKEMKAKELLEMWKGDEEDGVDE
jgi:ATP-dependent helicase/nuclease subunit B